MSEISSPEGMKIMQTLSSIREEFSLPPQQLRLYEQMMTGSQDPKEASRFWQRYLRQESNRSERSDKIETVDIDTQIEKFTTQERTHIFANLVGIQLTQGCNGHCPFCYLGRKDGVTAKYSFKSLEKFFNKYRYELIQKNGPPAVLFWDSDPFDYEDGKYSYKDVYRLWRSVFTNEPHSITTALSAGSEDRFISYMLEIHSAQNSSQFQSFYSDVKVRFSVNEHNLHRIERAIFRLTTELQSKGVGLGEIEAFINRHMFCETRKDIYKIGPLISETDPYKSLTTPACSDGVIISPESVDSIMMTAPTIYEPSGQKKFALQRKAALGHIPKTIFGPHWSGLKNLKVRAKLGYFTLPKIRSSDGAEFSLPGPVEDCVTKLGRDALTIKYAIRDLRYLPHTDEFSKLPRVEAGHYVEALFESLSQRLQDMNLNLSKAETVLRSGKLESDAAVEIKFYISLCQTFAQEARFLKSQFDNGWSVNIVSEMAKTLDEVGRDDVEKLPEIMSQILERQ